MCFNSKSIRVCSQQHPKSSGAEAEAQTPRAAEEIDRRRLVASGYPSGNGRWIGGVGSSRPRRKAQARAPLQGDSITASHYRVHQLKCQFGVQVRSNHYRSAV
jgi:hypothetical protein